MGSSIRIGRLRGIPIGAHWSLIVIGGLLTVTLATGLLPEVVDASPVAYWAAAALGAVLFLASILAHELSHALTAQRYGLVVEDITLWILGGLARFRSDAKTPRAQLVIALAGPAASVGAAVIFFAAALGLDWAGVGGVVPVTLAWLALVNVVLAVFNLLPGAPLDGGRVLAAVLWMRGGDRNRAAVSAARAGRVLGWILVALGLGNALFGIGFGTLWTALIGWFIVSASGAEEQAARIRAALEQLRVADVMDRHPVVASEDRTVRDALDYELSSDSVVLVQRFEAEDIVGLATRDAALAAHPASERRLADIAVDKSAITTTSPEAPAAALLDEAARQPVVVLDQGQVVGVVTLDDLAHLMSDRRPPDASGTRPRGGVGTG